VIGDRDFLERFYDKRDVEVLWGFHKATEKMEASTRNKRLRQALRVLWDNEADFIQNTHLIQTSEMGVEPLRWNKPQQRFYSDVITRCRNERRPIRGIVTKARQQGMSTFIQSWLYEQLDRKPHRQAMTINFDLVNTDELFAKARFIHTNHPCPRPIKRDRMRVLEFLAPHSSTFHTRSAGSPEASRSLTINYAHASEIPVWPDPESTFVALNQAVPAEIDSAIFQEATARGAVGHHYEYWVAAEEGRNDYVAFFSPWYWTPKYSMPFANDEARYAFYKTMSPADEVYRDKHGLSAEQMHWRRWKIHNDMQGSALKFQQEFPASADEAFLATGSTVFHIDHITRLRLDCTTPLWIGDAILDSSA
jgi:hypothetical protein